MKYLPAFFLLFGILNIASAQETTVIRRKITDAVTERFTVLKSDKNFREGLYTAFLTNTTNALARGFYKNNIKTGRWDFYDTHNQLIQAYDYNAKTLIYEAPEDTSSNCRYVVDDSLKNNPKTTKPVRIGDRYYGYINYLKLFKLPSELKGSDPDLFDVTLELLVSPYGRLAYYKVHLSAEKFRYNRSLTFNLDLLNDEDKTFLPATIDGKPAACRIFIACNLTDSGQIDFD